MQQRRPAETRNWNRPRIWLGVLLWLGSAGFAVASADLLEDLRAGGYVIYFRHVATDWSQQDQVRTFADVTSCDPQRMRQLSDEGRETARAIGAQIRRLGIPIGKVLASEYCRTVETARMLDLGEVQTTRDVINARAADYIGGRDTLARTARARLAETPRAGTNTVIVAHGNVFLLAAGKTPVEGGAAIVRADGRGGFTVVEMLHPEEWTTLAPAGPR